MPIGPIDRINNSSVEQLESLGGALLDFGSIVNLLEAGLNATDEDKILLTLTVAILLNEFRILGGGTSHFLVDKVQHHNPVLITQLYQVILMID